MDDLILDGETSKFLRNRWADSTSYCREQMLAAINDFLENLSGSQTDRARVMKAFAIRTTNRVQLLSESAELPKHEQLPDLR